jgi:hypothetical protein
LEGAYFFADYCTGEIWTLRYMGGQVTELINRTDELAPGNGLDIRWVSSFGRDAAGEIYICESTSNGEVFKIVADPSLELIGAQPPHLSIDARVPLLGEMLVGWDELTIQFAAQPFCVTASDFSASAVGGELTAPFVEIAKQLPGNSVQLLLSSPIEPLAWTIIYHHESMSEVQIGFLPGDVDASRITSPVDLLSLIDEINSPGALPAWSVDINRSNEVTAADVSALLALFDGAMGGQSYLGASLP